MALFLSGGTLVYQAVYWQASGKDYSVEPAESRRPFRALLDVGLVRTTTGNRVFGALKVTCLFFSLLRFK